MTQDKGGVLTGYPLAHDDLRAMKGAIDLMDARSGGLRMGNFLITSSVLMEVIEDFMLGECGDACGSLEGHPFLCDQSPYDLVSISFDMPVAALSGGSMEIVMGALVRPGQSMFSVVTQLDTRDGTALVQHFLLHVLNYLADAWLDGLGVSHSVDESADESKRVMMTTEKTDWSEISSASGFRFRTLNRAKRGGPARGSRQGSGGSAPRCSYWRRAHVRTYRSGVATPVRGHWVNAQRRSDNNVIRVVST